MNVGVRLASEEDREKIALWYKSLGQGFPGALLPYSSTFVAEVDGEALAAVALSLGGFSICHAEALISDPRVKGKKRKAAVDALLDHICRFAKDLNYRGIFCMAPNKTLKRYYEKMGFKWTGNVTVHVKEL